jgi:hypothetical protein
MKKKFTPEELAQIVTNLLTNPDSGELDESSKFGQFMTDIAKVVGDHCGGEIRADAAQKPTGWVVEIGKNDSLPAGGGVWKSRKPSDDEGDIK